MGNAVIAPLTPPFLKKGLHIIFSALNYTKRKLATYNYLCFQDTIFFIYEYQEVA